MFNTYVFLYVYYFAYLPYYKTTEEKPHCAIMVQCGLFIAKTSLKSDFSPPHIPQVPCKFIVTKGNSTVNSTSSLKIVNPCYAYWHIIPMQNILLYQSYQAFVHGEEPSSDCLFCLPDNPNINANIGSINCINIKFTINSLWNISKKM